MCIFHVKELANANLNTNFCIYTTGLIDKKIKGGRALAVKIVVCNLQHFKCRFMLNFAQFMHYVL